MKSGFEFTPWQAFRVLLVFVAIVVALLIGLAVLAGVLVNVFRAVTGL